MGISNIHLRLEDQQESAIAGDESYQESSRAHHNSDSREPPQPSGGQSVITDKICIGVTLKELTLRTTDSTANAAAEDTRGEHGEFEPMDSSSDSEEEEDQSTSGIEASKHDQLGKWTSGSDIQAPSEDEAGLVTKKVASQGAGSFFFDRTVKENRGVPLLREFSIKGFAIYIDSGLETQLISFPSSKSAKPPSIREFGEEGIIEGSSRAPLPDKEVEASKRDPAMTSEELDKAMQELHKQLFEVALDPRPCLSPEEAGAADRSSRAGDGSSDPEKPAVVANFIIKPQSVYGRIVQQTADFELPDVQPNSGHGGQSKKPKQKSARKAAGSMGTEASGKTTTNVPTKSSPTTSAP